VQRNNPHDAAIALVRKAKAGDRGAFCELVRRYRERIVALALHITGSQSDADDVTQEVFLAAFRALDSFEERSQFFTWLYRVAVNRSLNMRRSRKRRGETTTLEDPRVERAVAIDAGGNPARAAGLRQTYSRLLAALDGLPASMRTTVVLVTLQGLSHGEAAVVQNCSPGTIAWRVHVARHRLREALGYGRDRSDTPVPNQEPSEELAELLREWGWPVLTPF
jgi:RNA polymerase sigma-70 factor (ECF subfamily)